MGGKIIVKNACVREPGFLYYIDGQGNLCRSEMVHGRKKGSGKKKKEKTAKAVKTTKKALKKTVLKKVLKK